MWTYSVEAGMRSKGVTRVTPAEAVPPVRRWEAKLALSFARAKEWSLLVSRRRRGPLVVQRPLYPEGAGVCHTYIVHPPGGLAGGDDLEVSVNVGVEAAALVTTPAATKVYRTLGAPSVQSIVARVEGRGSLEWLPLEALAFEGSRFDSALRFEIASTSKLVAWDVVCLGSPASGVGFERGAYHGHLTLVRDGALELVEVTRIGGGTPVAKAAFGLRGCAALGTMVVHPAPQGVVERVRAMVSGTPLAGVTCVHGILVLRSVGVDGQGVRRLFEDVWCAIREDVIGRRPSPPRIWAT